MINSGILKKKLIGNAIVCSLSLESEEAQGLLILNSIHKKVQFEKTLPLGKKVELVEYFSKLNLDIKTIILDNSTISIILNSQIIPSSTDKKISGFKILLVSC